MDKETQSAKIRELAASIAPNIKTEQELDNLTRELVKQTVEMALSRELDAHLGYTKHSPSGHNTGNSRNGTSHKTLQSEKGRIRIQTPRDRMGSFEPQLIKKGQTRLTLLDEQILSLYARGMTTRDISATIQEMCGAEVSPTIDVSTLFRTHDYAASSILSKTSGVSYPLDESGADGCKKLQCIRISQPWLRREFRNCNDESVRFSGCGKNSRRQHYPSNYLSYSCWREHRRF